jgi:hypothetical protein
VCCGTRLCGVWKGTDGPAYAVQKKQKHGRTEIVSSRLEDQADSHPNAGIGARFKVERAAAFRVEYETINPRRWDNTTMLSLGVGRETPGSPQWHSGPINPRSAAIALASR